MVAFPDTYFSGCLVHRKAEGKGISSITDHSGKRDPDTAKIDRELEELGQHIAGYQKHDARSRALPRIATTLALINLVAISGSWLSLRSNLAATNQATSRLIRDIDAANDAQVVAIIDNVKSNNEGIVRAIDGINRELDNNQTIIQGVQGTTDNTNKLVVGLQGVQEDQKKLLHSVEILLTQHNQTIADVSRNSKTAANAARNAEAIATKTRTTVQTKIAKQEPSIMEKIFGSSTTTKTTTKRKRR